MLGLSIDSKPYYQRKRLSTGPRSPLKGFSWSILPTALVRLQIACNKLQLTSSLPGGLAGSSANLATLHTRTLFQDSPCKTALDAAHAAVDTRPAPCTGEGSPIIGTYLLWTQRRTLRCFPQAEWVTSCGELVHTVTPR